MMSGRTLVIVTDFDLYGLGEKPRERLVKVLEELPEDEEEDGLIYDSE